jgi:hypothetical protein
MAAWRNLFPLLGVNAVIGRTFTENEDRPDGNAVMLTWNLFERRFGGNPSIVGWQIHLDGKPYTLIGVLPKWFTYWYGSRMRRGCHRQFCSIMTLALAVWQPA